MKQLGLFSLPEPAELDWSAERALAAGLPKNVRFGTSSWSFPGWAGIVYRGKPSERDLAHEGLAEYAKHPLFGTVGIDRSYYAPIPEADLARYATQLPAGFPCVLKAWSAITTYADPRSGELVPTYLDPVTWERDVAAPLRASFRAHVGAIVLEFPPRRALPPSPSERFAAELDRFFSSIAKDLPLAVEIRNRELLAPPYLEVLKKHGVAHCLNLWEKMPDIGAQLALPGILPASFVVCRLLLRPGTRYEERRAEFLPFDRIVDENPKMRADVEELAKICEATGRVLFVLVNNKAEGSSPLTIRALAERMQRNDTGRREGAKG